MLGTAAWDQSLFRIDVIAGYEETAMLHIARELLQSTAFQQKHSKKSLNIVAVTRLRWRAYRFCMGTCWQDYPCDT